MNDPSLKPSSTSGNEPWRDKYSPAAIEDDEMAFAVLISDFADLRKAVQTAVDDLAGEMNLCAQAGQMCSTCAEVLDPIYQRLRAALAPATTTEEDA